jgi:hypothetical protein|tara:strand:- start:1621 stop:1821 length:201 start_codon:yes stop_codon:yes gene_type:complete
MRYELVWGHSEFRGMDETKIKGSSNLDLLEDAQRLLGDMNDDDLMKYLDVDDTVLNEGIYFRIKTL